ncbi:unnamed protein product [Lactuca virosa]|uniref:Uncharacterized protein n=1 Tax=Lactuca virosa TaxID=75947 RepID=A0AAU9P3D4_9ASTR|nr:unnamed protein product [Lactuca virosa]
MGDISMKIHKKSNYGIAVIKNWRNQFSISRIRLPNLRELLEKRIDSDSIHVKNPQYTGPVAFLVLSLKLLYLHCTKSSSESLERIYPTSSYWTPIKVKDKLKEAFSDGGYEKVEVIVFIVLDHSEKGINIVHEKSIENEVPTVLDIADKGKNVVEDNTKENQEDWMDSSPSVPRFDIIFDGSKSLEYFKEKNDFLFKSYSYLKPTIDHWINHAWNQFPGNKEIWSMLIKEMLNLTNFIKILCYLVVQK